MTQKYVSNMFRTVVFRAGQFWTSKTCLNYKSNSLQLMILKNDSQKYVSKMFQTDMFSAGQFWTVMDSFESEKSNLLGCSIFIFDMIRGAADNGDNTVR